MKKNHLSFIIRRIIILKLFSFYFKFSKMAIKTKLGIKKLTKHILYVEKYFKIFNNRY